MTEKKRHVVCIIGLSIIVVIVGAILWYQPFFAYDDSQPLDNQTWPTLIAGASTIFLDTLVTIQAKNLNIDTLYSIYLNYNPLFAFTASEEKWVFTRAFKLDECISEGNQLYLELYLIEWDPLKIWDHLRINVEEVKGHAMV